MSYGVVYACVCSVNNKRYIGQTIRKDPNIRFRRHFDDAKGGRKSLLSNAIRKYGDAAFKFDIICHCDDQDELNAQESLYIHLYNTFAPHGYNLRDGGAKGRAAESTREKMRIVWADPDFRAHMSEVLSAAQNRPDVKAHNIKRNKEHYASSEVRRIHSEKTKEAMRRPEVMERLRIAMSDKAVRLRLSESIKAMMKRPGMREKYVAAAHKRNSDPAFRQSQIEARERPGYREKHLAAVKAALARPDVKERQIAGVRVAMSRPEVRSALSEASKRTWQRPEHVERVSTAISKLKWWRTPEGTCYRASMARSENDINGRLVWRTSRS